MIGLTDRWRLVLLPMVVSVLLFVSGCTIEVPSPYTQVQEDTTGRGAPAAVAKTAEPGATFNSFFPSDVEGYDLIPTQEKQGFAEYKVLKDGTTVAMLSMNDTISNPTAAAKYQASTFQVDNYPAVDQGTTATGILVNNRYQIKVLSRDPSFTRDDRIAWLRKFDLRGVAQLEPHPQSAAAIAPAPSPAPVLPSKRPLLVPQPAT